MQNTSIDPLKQVNHVVSGNNFLSRGLTFFLQKLILTLISNLKVYTIRCLL